MKLLTPKESIILSVIKKFIARNGQAPTFSELQEEAEKMGLKIKSKSSISAYIASLEEKGFLETTSEKRGITIFDKARDFFVDIPILGATSAGIPTELAEGYVQGYLKVAKRIVGNKNVFAVQVYGTSMNRSIVNGKNIKDGDFIVVDSEYKDYQNGDKLLVVIDGYATIKKFKRIDEDRLVLLPESADAKHNPIYLTPEDSFIISGKAIEVLET